jgi:hypothetical protein
MGAKVSAKGTQGPLPKAIPACPVRPVQLLDLGPAERFRGVAPGARPRRRGSDGEQGRQGSGGVSPSSHAPGRP